MQTFFVLLFSVLCIAPIASQEAVEFYNPFARLVQFTLSAGGDNLLSSGFLAQGEKYILLDEWYESGEGRFRIVVQEDGQKFFVAEAYVFPGMTLAVVAADSVVVFLDNEGETPSQKILSGKSLIVFDPADLAIGEYVKVYGSDWTSGDYVLGGFVHNDDLSKRYADIQTSIGFSKFLARESGATNEAVEIEELLDIAQYSVFYEELLYYLENND
jgi:hypothetical protein